MLKRRLLPIMFLCLCLLLTGCQKDGLKKEYADHIADEQQELILQYLETYQQALDAAKSAGSIFEMGGYEHTLNELFNEIDTSLSADVPEPVQAVKYDLLSLEYIFTEISTYCKEINFSISLGNSHVSAYLNHLPSLVLDLGIMSEADIPVNSINEIQNSAFFFVEAKLTTFIETYCNSAPAGSEAYIDPMDVTMWYNDAVLSVEEAYRTAINLTKAELKKDGSLSGFQLWTYKDISIPYDDCEFINNTKINSKGIVNQGAIYRAMAEALERLIRLHSQNPENLNLRFREDAFILLGEVPAKEDFITQAKKATAFISVDDSVNKVLTTFEGLSCIDGTFDYGNNKYEFIISDVSICAVEMGISEEMLGYILAMFDEYSADIQFGNGSCYFSLTITKY